MVSFALKWVYSASASCERFLFSNVPRGTKTQKAVLSDGPLRFSGECDEACSASFYITDEVPFGIFGAVQVSAVLPAVLKAMFFGTETE